MTWKPFYGLKLLPEGLFGLIRKKTLEKGQFRLNLTYDKKSDQWVSDAEWTPLKGLKADTPWALLVAIAKLIAPPGEIEITDTSKEPRQIERTPIDHE